MWRHVRSYDRPQRFGQDYTHEYSFEYYPTRLGVIRHGGEYLVNLKPEDAVARGISHVPEGRNLSSQRTALKNPKLSAFPANTHPCLKESLDQVFDLFPNLKIEYSNLWEHSAEAISGRWLLRGCAWCVLSFLCWTNPLSVRLTICQTISEASQAFPGYRHSQGIEV